MKIQTLTFCQAVKAIVEKGAVTVSEEQIFRSPYKDIKERENQNAFQFKSHTKSSS